MYGEPESTRSTPIINNIESWNRFMNRPQKIVFMFFFQVFKVTKDV